jgi:hypothetical protein
MLIDLIDHDIKWADIVFKSAMNIQARNTFEIVEEIVESKIPAEILSNIN